VPVTSITGIPTSVQTNTDLYLNGTVNPFNATNKNVSWSIRNDGGTRSSLSGNRLTAAAPGTVEVLATVVNGLSPTANYTQPFSIAVNAPTSTVQTPPPPATVVPAFVPVTSITGIPTSVQTNTDLYLNGTVNPFNATNKNVSWSIRNDGGTRSSLSGNRLTATAPGTVEVLATVVNGLSPTTNYTQPFSIRVNAPTPPPATGTGTAQTPPPAATGSQVLSREVYFEPDTAVLIDSYWPVLEAVGRELAANPALHLSMRAYAAPFKTEEGRYMVSVDRARFCRNYFMDNYNIASSRISFDAFGSEEAPEHATSAEWMTYRCVELIVHN
jgi:outer membrane protein OmpA-like peptidoglycan-associated protein